MNRSFLLLALAASFPAAAAANTEIRDRVERAPPVPGVDVPRYEVSKTLFLNRCAGGCIIDPGPSDARFDTSSIVSATSLVSPWRHSDETWTQLVQCVREVYAPYGVDVTDVDPGEDVFHHEAIVAGNWDEIGYPNPVGGVAPSQCVPANNVISFTFANGYPANPILICATVAQETAHSYGLEHALDCSDPMTYLQACGRQFFRDRTTPCGEFEERDCVCGGNAQNSHRWLKTVLGPNSTPVPGPEVAIADPPDGDLVADGFRVLATAAHIRGIASVELLLNGTSYEVRDGHAWDAAQVPYAFDTPADLADGVIDVEVVATNDIGTESVARVTVAKGPPCTSASQCHAGQECSEGRCYWPPPTGALGDACSSGAECVSGLCPVDGEGTGRCSQECFPTETENTCPNGFTCVARNASEGLCWPAPDSGGCRAGGPVGLPAALALLALLLVPRRRPHEPPVPS